MVDSAASTPKQAGQLADNLPSRNIIITHYVNPHLFWFKFNNVTDIESELTAMERQLSAFVSQRPNAEDEIYKVNDYVAVHDGTLQRYIRGVIKDLQMAKCYNMPEHYIIWAIDHGYPLRTRREQLRWLPIEFFMQRQRILRGGLANIWPLAELTTNDGQRRYQRADKWCQSACQQIAELLQSSEHQMCANLCFVENIDNIEHYWCEVQVILPNGQVTTPERLLAKQNLCQVYALDLFRLKRNCLSTYKENAWQSLKQVKNITEVSEYFEKNKHAIIECQERCPNVQGLRQRLLSMSLPGGTNYPNRDGLLDDNQENNPRKQFIAAYGEKYLTNDKELQPKNAPISTQTLQVVDRQVFAKPGSANFTIVATNKTQTGNEQAQSESNMLNELSTRHCSRTRMLNDEVLRLAANMQQLATTGTQNEAPFVHKSLKKQQSDTQGHALDATQSQVSNEAPTVRLSQNCTWITIGTKLTPIKVSSSSDYADIYAQLATAECLDKYEALGELLKQRVGSLKPLLLSELLISEIYIVSDKGKLYRALLQRINNRDTKLTCRFLYVDVGQLCDVSAQDVDLNLFSIYQCTREITEYTAFQAIHCTLAGIEINQQRASLHNISLKQFIICLSDDAQTSCLAYPCVGNLKEIALNMYMNSYEIELIACACNKAASPSPGVIVNKALVDWQLAALSANAKFHFGVLANNY